jgi:hypothetical protein
MSDSTMLYCSILLHVTDYSYVIRRLTCKLVLNFLNFKVLKFENYFHITVALHVLTEMVIIRCFEIAELPSIHNCTTRQEELPIAIKRTTTHERIQEGILWI